jgi:succinylglutamate desuccinylase
MERIIGTYTQHNKGPLLLVFGGVHGNEPAGVEALRILFQMLEKEPELNPGFEFRGTIIGLVGNQRAYAAGMRYLSQDLNRAWKTDDITWIRSAQPQQLVDESAEISELISLITSLIETYTPSTLLLLDLHTTSAGGGIFCIPGDEADSLHLASLLRVPVILGLMNGIEGTMLKYLMHELLQQNPHPPRTMGVAFEAGQHNDPDSVSRSIAAIINCMRAGKLIDEKDVDSRHHEILDAYSRNLPKITLLRHVHHTQPEDLFKMRPGYVNFQPIAAGEHLADNIRGKILSPMDGMILMPLYQPKGADGFFIVEPV